MFIFIERLAHSCYLVSDYPRGWAGNPTALILRIYAPESPTVLNLNTSLTPYREGERGGEGERGLSSIINSAGCLIFDSNCLHKDNGTGERCRLPRLEAAFVSTRTGTHTRTRTRTRTVGIHSFLYGKFVKKSKVVAPQDSLLSALALFPGMVYGIWRHMEYRVCMYISARSDLVKELNCVSY